MKKIEREEYTIIFTNEGRVEILLNDRELRRKFKTSMLYSYNKWMWLKASGGRKVDFMKLFYHLKADDIKEIERYFELMKHG